MKFSTYNKEDNALVKQPKYNKKENACKNRKRPHGTICKNNKNAGKSKVLYNYINK